MITLTYHQEINAPAEKVWDVLWNKETYPVWTRPFSEVSTMTSDWKVGGQTSFTDGKNNGMLSTILSMNQPNEIIFKHLGELKDGKPTLFHEGDSFEGSLEKYILTEHNGVTQLTASVDILPQYKEMMDNGFNSGLQVVKQLSEK